jgi:hypothetical protein
MNTKTGNDRSPEKPRSSPQTHRRKRLSEGFEWDYSVVTVRMMEALTGDEVKVYVVVDARCKNHPENKNMTTEEIKRYLPSMSDARLRKAIRGLCDQGYFKVSQGGVNGTFRCTVIFNSVRNPAHIVPTPLATVPTPAVRYIRPKGKSPVDADGNLIHDPRPQCVAITKNGNGSPCRSHAIADSDRCIAHQPKASDPPAVKTVGPPAVKTVARELSKSPRQVVDPAVEITAQVLVIKTAGREEASASDRTAALLCNKEGLVTGNGTGATDLPDDEQDEAKDRLYVDGGRIILAAPHSYGQRLNADCKKIDGRAWDWTLRLNTFPTSSATAVCDLATRWGFAIPHAITDLLDAAVAA